MESWSVLVLVTRTALNFEKFAGARLVVSISPKLALDGYRPDVQS